MRASVSTRTALWALVAARGTCPVNGKPSVQFVRHLDRTSGASSALKAMSEDSLTQTRDR